MARRSKRRQRGTGQVFQKAPGSWAIRWWEGRKCRFKGGFTDRVTAERALDRIRGEIAQNRAGLPPDPKGFPALSELADAWLERRDSTHRCADDDRGRWDNHLAPHFAHLKPSEVDTAKIRAFIEKKRKEGLSPATVRLCVMLLSSLFGDLCERSAETGATANPVRALPKSARALIRPDHDPRTTPFVEKLADVRRIYLALEEPVSVAYAVGALAGLRTGEILALKWEHVDLANRRVHVRESVGGPLKDKDSRVVPVLDALHPILTQWKLRTGGSGLVVPPMRSDGERCDQHTVGKYLRAALKELKLPRITWYQATRHTFASQWVMSGGSIEKLREMLGHCSVLVTERYAHLRPDSFSDRDRGTIAVDLRPGGEVARAEPGTIEHPMSTGAGSERASAAGGRATT